MTKTLEELKQIYIELNDDYDETITWFVPQKSNSTLGIMVGIDWEGKLIVLDIDHPYGETIQVADFGDYDTFYQEERD
jgi:hypothetical protein